MSAARALARVGQALTAVTIQRGSPSVGCGLRSTLLTLRQPPAGPKAKKARTTLQSATSSSILLSHSAVAFSAKTRSEKETYHPIRN